MEYRQLGRAGVRVSVLGLGTNRFGSDRLPQAAASWTLTQAELDEVNTILAQAGTGTET